jgi:iron(III) transport system ATP-binding protein
MEVSQSGSPKVADVIVNDVRKSFGKLEAVKGVSFQVRSGEFVTLLGPSGCGKTTTLRMIAGLERPDAGEIRVGEHVLNDAARGVFVQPERRHMGMVFQTYAIWPHMTVFQNVAFPLEEQRVNRSEVRERVSRMLAMVGLEEYINVPAPNLSGGQQQRVALARALVTDPEVLLLDEPLSNLDARLREQMRFEIRETQVRLGITTIFVTHDQLEAMTMSDQVIVMQAGRIEQHGTPREVYNQPRTRQVMDFLGQVNHLPGRVQALEGGLYACYEGGKLAVPLFGDTWNVGEPVSIAFRSESVCLSPPSGRGLVGTIDAATFIGSAIEYVVRVGTTRIRVAGSNADSLSPGDTVELQIAPRGIQTWKLATGG